jgi:uncharacterized membrane protein YdjX (TVP38/TMEM64 family)
MDTFFTDVQLWLETIGIWAYVAAPVIMAMVSILPIPAEAPAMMNGMLFGPTAGTTITWGGAMIGAWISFELARVLGRPLAERLIAPRALAKADAVAQDAGWWGLLGARLVPLIAFTALNWGAGLCSVPRWRFLWTTALGILPGAIVFTASGTGLAMLLERFPSAGRWLLLVVLVAAVWWVVRRRSQPPLPERNPTVEAAVPGESSS